MMNLSGINLNLLVALDALLTEKNVTKAGKKLFLTQSTMSALLRQSRELFQDKLLVRNGKKMVLTTRAIELAPQIRQMLGQIENLVSTSTFNPKVAKREFVLGITEYADYLLLPTLYNILQKEAPDITLKIKTISMFNDDQIVDDEFDLLIGAARKENELITESLFNESLVCAARFDHPLMKSAIKLENYLKANHLSVVINPYNNHSMCNPDAVLRTMGYSRRVILRACHNVSALMLIAKSDLLIIVPEGMVKIANQTNIIKLAYQQIPFPMPTMDFIQMWHKKFSQDSAHIWLRTKIKEAVKQALPDMKPPES